MTALPPDFETLPAIQGDWGLRSVSIAPHSFELILPAQPDELLENDDDRAPYWGYLWPTAYDFAAWILKRHWQPAGKVLEIGCGIGLAGLAGLTVGWDVTLSDYEPLAVQLATVNAHRHGFSNAEGMVLDWQHPSDTQFSTIMGCDVTYDIANHASLAGLLDSMLAEEGVCWLADPFRENAEFFAQTMQERGYASRCEELPAVPFSGRPQLTNRLWKITRQID